MIPNVTDFDFIRGAFPLLPKEMQDELAATAMALAVEAEKTQEATEAATRIAARRWMNSVFNDMGADDWNEHKERGYDLAFLNALKQEATKYGNTLALEAQDGYLSEWENIIYVYAFAKGKEAARDGH